MSQEIIDELVSFLAKPGVISQSSWNDAYMVVSDRNSPNETFLYRVVSVASRVARARRVRLPDVLHNIMVLWQSFPETGDWQQVSKRRKGKEYVTSYMKMVAKLTSLEETKTSRNNS